MSNTTKIGFILLSCLLGILKTGAQDKCPTAGNPDEEIIKWDNTLVLPAVESKDNIGVAGAFSGFIGENLIIAGGANFPDNTPWNGGHKTWWNMLYSINITTKNEQWNIKQNILPKALAYGVSIQLPEGILCIGGCDSAKCSDQVFLLHQDKGQVKASIDWPTLPTPLANATGALLNNKVYIAGGQESMDKQEATNHFYVLDLSNRKKGWQALPTWPGPHRGYAVSAVQSDGSDLCFYLFSGRNYKADGYVQVLTDGYAYNPRLNVWKQLNQKFPVMAGTALASGANHIIFLGGVPQLIPGSDEHPGFDNTVRLYHTITNTLLEKETLPYPIAVTTHIASKNKTFYITSGEVKPGIRTPHLLRGEIIPFDKGLGLLNTVVIILYFASLAWIGYYFSKKQKNTHDYFKGGGRLPWWAVGLSIFGTSLSAITFMSIPAKAYSSDWSYMLVNAGILMVVPLIL